MKLIKTVELNFGNKALADWEQECEAVRLHNQNLLPTWQEVKLYTIYKSSDFDASSVWEQDITEKRATWLLNLEEIAPVVQKDDWCNTKYEIVESGTKILEVAAEQLPEPPKPEVRIFNRQLAYDELLKVQPKLKAIQPHDLNNYHFDENLGQYVCPDNCYVATWTYPKVLRMDTFWRDLGEDGRIFVTRKYYKQELYRVFPDRLEVWEKEYCDEILPEGGGSVGEAGIGSWSDKGIF